MKFGTALTRWAGAAALLALAAPVEAEASSETVCLSKTDASGARMRFAVRRADASTFESAGFVRTTCPSFTAEVIAVQKARCDGLRARTAESKALIRDLYGLSVDEMCAATDTWAASMMEAAQ